MNDGDRHLRVFINRLLRFVGWPLYASGHVSTLDSIPVMVW